MSAAPFNLPNILETLTWSKSVLGPVRSAKMNNRQSQGLIIMCECVCVIDGGGSKWGTETDLLTRNDIRQIKRGAIEKS